jgi:hypothetical protein
MGLRRPNLVLWDSYTDKCLNEIGYTQDSLPSDKALCEWIRLQRITEDAERQVVRDEISVLGISDSKAQNWLKGFERKVEDWDTQKSTQVSSCKSFKPTSGKQQDLDLL